MIDTIRCGRFEIGVIYEDNHLLCVEKPANLPVQRDASRDDDLLSILKEYIKRTRQKPGDAYLGLVHRLDRPVGGVMAFARTSKAAARLSAQFAAHTVEKRYLAVLEGALAEALALKDYLAVDERTGTARVADADTEGAKLARLSSRPIAVRENLTLCDITLETGRKHQIRAQHAHAGYPLWGDARYGRGKPGMQLALWARALEFEHPTLKTRVTLTSRPPDAGAWRLFSAELNTIIAP